MSEGLLCLRSKHKVQVGNGVLKNDTANLVLVNILCLKVNGKICQSTLLNSRICEVCVTSFPATCGLIPELAVLVVESSSFTIGSHLSCNEGLRYVSGINPERNGKVVTNFPGGL